MPIDPTQITANTLKQDKTEGFRPNNRIQNTDINNDPISSKPYMA